MTELPTSSSPTPLTPPQLDEDRLSWLRLLRSRRVGVATFYRLMAEHGSAGAALAALPGVAAAAGVTDYSPTDESRAQIEMRAAARFGARMICRGEPDYPAELDRIDDAPPLIWARGDLAQLRRPMVAMVGARNASSLGERTARMLAGALGEAGYVVVSGLARGVDGAAHRGALAADPAAPGATLAVLAGGVDHVYPSAHAALADQIAARIDQGAAGIARIHRRIGLQKEGIIRDANIGPCCGRDNPGRDRLSDPERIAYCKHQVADFNRARICIVERWKFIAFRINAQDG